MNIQTVAENLKRTIANKEKYLAEVNEAVLNTQGTSQHVAATTARFLEINIRELKVILFDVEQCVAKDIEQSWRDNPDRMGGQFTQDEIDNAERWQ